jgi:hypothetical protein
LPEAASETSQIHGVVIRLLPNGEMKMSDERELAIAEYEHARNVSVDEYFEARPQIERTIERERLVEAGYRMAWRFLKGDV